MMELAQIFTTGVIMGKQEETMIDRIRSMMELKRMKQVDLAREAGISPSALSNIMSGRRVDLEAETLRRLAEALQVTVDYLLGTGPKAWSSNNPPIRSPEANQIARMVEDMPDAGRTSSLEVVSKLYEHYRQHKQRDELIDALLDIIESNHGLEFRRELESRLGLSGQEFTSTDEAVSF